MKKEMMKRIWKRKEIKQDCLQYIQVSFECEMGNKAQESMMLGKILKVVVIAHIL